MGTTTLGELISGDNPLAESRQCLYVVRDSRGALYVGKTERIKLGKRFLSHLGEGPYPANIKFDKELKKSMPAANSWTVQTLSQEEWNELFSAQGLPRRHKLNTAESALIRLLKPAHNVKSHPDHSNIPAWLKSKKKR